MLRRLTAADTATYRELRLLSRTTDPQAFISTLEYEQNLSENHFTQSIYQYHHGSIFGIWGDFQNQRLRAIATLAQDFLPKQRHLANLYDVYVHPDHRRHHLATGLLRHLIDNLHTVPEIEQLHLRVNSSNVHALHLYQKIGFRHFATRPKAIKNSDLSYQDELLFVFTL